MNTTRELIKTVQECDFVELCRLIDDSEVEELANSIMYTMLTLLSSVNVHEKSRILNKFLTSSYNEDFMAIVEEQEVEDDPQGTFIFE